MISRYAYMLADNHADIVTHPRIHPYISVYTYMPTYTYVPTGAYFPTHTYRIACCDKNSSNKSQKPPATSRHRDMRRSPDSSSRGVNRD